MPNWSHEVNAENEGCIQNQAQCPFGSLFLFKWLTWNLCHSLVSSLFFSGMKGPSWWLPADVTQSQWQRRVEKLAGPATCSFR